jgi:hypothetical protein
VFRIKNGLKMMQGSNGNVVDRGWAGSLVLRAVVFLYRNGASLLQLRKTVNDRLAVPPHRATKPRWFVEWHSGALSEGPLQN